jgi:hypothetical protein
MTYIALIKNLLNTANTGIDYGGDIMNYILDISIDPDDKIINIGNNKYVVNKYIINTTTHIWSSYKYCKMCVLSNGLLHLFH